MFIGTKAITHFLIGDIAERPEEWSTVMVEAEGDAALIGFTAFSRADAAHTGRRLLANEPVKLKDTNGQVRLGQIVMRD